MPLLKNNHGRIVAVSQSRVKALKREGFTIATDEEVAAWQAKNSAGERVRAAHGFELPDGYADAIGKPTKAELIAFALEHFALELSDSMNKAPIVEAILDAAIAQKKTPLPE